MATHSSALPIETLVTVAGVAGTLAHHRLPKNIVLSLFEGCTKTSTKVY
jgi:hypothetical protein